MMNNDWKAGVGEGKWEITRVTFLFFFHSNFRSVVIMLALSGEVSDDGAGSRAKRRCR